MIITPIMKINNKMAITRSRYLKVYLKINNISKNHDYYLIDRANNKQLAYSLSVSITIFRTMINNSFSFPSNPLNNHCKICNKSR